MRLEGPEGDIEITIPTGASLTREGCERQLSHQGHKSTVFVARDGIHVWVSQKGVALRFSLPDTHTGHQSGDVLRAPMTGRVVSIPVAIGDAVAEGDTVAIIEAMKMEYRLEAEGPGEVVEIGAAEGDLVDLGQVVVRIK